MFPRVLSLAVAAACLAVAPPPWPRGVAPAPAAEASVSPQAGGPGGSTEVQRLVRQLGDDDYATREAAEKRLRAIGVAADEALAAALESTDAEVRERARRVLQDIRRRIVRTDTLWESALPAGPAASPVVAGGLVFIATVEGSVHAYEAASGKRKWSSPLPAIVTARLATAGDLLLVAGADRRVHALDIRTGAAAWQFPAFAAVSGAARSGDVVALAAGAQVYGLAAATGKLRWQSRLPAPVTGGPAAIGDAFLVPAADKSLRLLDAGTGTQRWHRLTSTASWSAPACRDGVLHLASATGLLALYAGDGRTKWEAAGGSPTAALDSLDADVRGAILNAGWSPSAPALAGDLLLQAAGQRVHAIDLATGKPRWRFEADAGDDPVADAATGGPRIVRLGGGGVVVLGGRMPMVIGGQRFGMELDPGGVAAEAGVAVLPTEAGLFAVELKTGMQLWRFAVPTPLAGEAAIADGVVYFAGTAAERPTAGKAEPDEPGGVTRVEARLYALPLKPRAGAALGAPVMR